MTTIINTPAADVVSFTDFVAAASTAFAASERLNSRAPLFNVETAKGKRLYCGWSIDRAVAVMASNPRAIGTLCSFDVDGRALYQLPMPR